MLTKDFKEFVELLTKHRVEYILVGGYAVGIHGYPRYTGDFDIWINPSIQNASKILSAVNEFGFSSYNLKIEDLLKNKKSSGRHRDLDDLENLKRL